MGRRKSDDRRLTDLELEVMHVVWDAENPLTIREVLERLNDGRRRKFAYTTIQTMMLVLKRKGIVRSKPTEGRAHAYSARISKDRVTGSMVTDFVDRLFSGHAEPLLSRLVDHESLDRSQLEDLRRRIDEQLEDEEPER